MHVLYHNFLQTIYSYQTISVHVESSSAIAYQTTLLHLAWKRRYSLGFEEASMVLRQDAKWCNCTPTSSQAGPEIHINSRIFGVEEG